MTCIMNDLGSVGDLMFSCMSRADLLMLRPIFKVAVLGICNSGMNERKQSNRDLEKGYFIKNKGQWN